MVYITIVIWGYVHQLIAKYGAPPCMITSPSVIQVERIRIGRPEAPAQRIAPLVQGHHAAEDGGAVLATGIRENPSEQPKPWEKHGKTRGKIGKP